MAQPISRRSVLGAAAAIPVLPLQAPGGGPTFRVQDWLGRDWRGERVRYAIEPATAELLRHGHGFVGAAGAGVPFELLGEAVELLVSVPPYGEARFGLKAGAPNPPTDLRVRETPDRLVLANSHGQVAIRRKLAGDEAPIAGIDRGDGTWVGAARFTAPSDAVASYEAGLERRGPLAATVVCRTVFASGVSWELRVTLQASDPAVLIDERWSQWDHAGLALDFADRLAPTHVYYRNGADHGSAVLGQVAFEPLVEASGATVFELEPWLHWWFSPRRGNWLAAWSERAPKALAIAVLRGDAWLSEADIALGRWPEPLQVVRRAGGLELVLPPKGAQRSWLLAMLPPETIDRTLVGQRVAPPPQDLVIRHGDFPLDRVKDLVLSWPRGRAPQTRLMLAPADLERLKSSAPKAASVQQARQMKFGASPANDASLNLVVGAYLATGDAELGRKLSNGALAQMQGAVDLFIRQDELVTMGFAPHWQRQILYAAHLADFGMADALLSDAERDRLRAQAAFLAYTVSRPDYWSPARGFFANPSMTSTVAAYKAYLACLIHDHPLAPGWLDASLAELFDKELLGWSDEDGGWLEAPHYAMNALEYLLGVGVCAANKGRRELIDHPRLRRIVEWLAKITTPPDARIAGVRHLPPIGNTLVLEPTGEFGLAASLWRKTDPELSARLQWAHRASGSPAAPYIGGAYPAFAPYRDAFADASLPASAPHYGSELFRKTGAILRAHFGTDRETQLLMIAGANHQHYDYDSGSITLWGKGRRIADDFGYTGRAPMSDHSMVDSPGNTEIFQITAFSSSEFVDYLEGNSGGWRRQVLFVKSPDPLGPNYYVIRDRLDAPASGTWRLWLAGKVSLDGSHALAVGEDDVDTDIALFGSEPFSASLQTISRSSPGGPAGSLVTTTQTAINAPLAGGAWLTSIVYPRLRTAQPMQSRRAPQAGVFHVGSGDRTDTIVMSESVLQFSEAGQMFRGRVGALIGRGAGGLAAPVIVDPGDQR